MTCGIILHVHINVSYPYSYMYMCLCRCFLIGKRLYRLKWLIFTLYFFGAKFNKVQSSTQKHKKQRRRQNLLPTVCLKPLR